MSRIHSALVALVVAVMALAVPGVALGDEPHLDMNNPNVEPLPIAIPEFSGGQVARDMTQVVSADLERSGLFRPLDPRSFIDKDAATRSPPNFNDWRVINASALVTGTVEGQSDGRLQVEFRLWDVLDEVQMTGVRYTTTPQNWRRIPHIMADAIYKRITGEEGYFDTRIVYISETGPADKRIKRLAIMDQDGANHRFLTDGRALVLTPRFSPSTQEITYLSYARSVPRVYLFNIDTGQQEVLGDFPGMTFSPRFSPDGNKVLMSLAIDGNSDVYSLDLRTRQAARLTDNPAIDTSPSASPDGKQIVFNSDRGGSQQLYVMKADGSDPKRISFDGEARYGTPVWSPRGDLVAFTKIAGGKFSIGVMKPDGSGERLLTTDFLVEGPTWAPNGRVLMYTRQGRTDSSGNGRSRIYSIDLTGHNEREVVTPQDASDPAWSPLIP